MQKVDWIKIANSKIWYMFYVIIIFLLFIFRRFIGISDATSTWFSPSYNLKNLLSVWDTYNGIGAYIPHNFTPFFQRLFYLIFELFSNHPSIIQKMAWLTYFSLASLLVMFLINKMLSNKFYAMLASIFLFFNPVMQLAGWGKQHATYYLPLPYFLGIYFYFRFCETKKYFYLILIPIIWIFYGTAFNQPAYLAPFFLAIFVLFLYQIPTEKKKILFIWQNISMMLIFILVNFVYILPLFSGGTTYLNTIRSYYGGSQLPILDALKSENFFYSFINFHRGYGYDLPDGFWPVMLWTILLGSIFYFSLVWQIKDRYIKKKLLTFTTILLIAIFFIKGLTPPFTKLSEKIYSINYMYIFRDFKDKFSILYSIALSFIVIYLYKLNIKWLKILLLIVTIFSVITFATNWWIQSLSYTYSPYVDDLAYLRTININSDHNSRILSLPLGSYQSLYISEPHYAGDSPLKNIFRKDVISHSQIGFFKQEQEIKNALEKNNLSPKLFYRYLQTKNVEYILNNKNQYIPEDSDPHAYKYQTLKQYSFLRKIQDTKYFELYQFNDFYPLINGKNVEFQKINNSKYKVFIKNINSKEQLNFLTSYSPDWKLYLQKNPTNKWCQNSYYFSNINTIECKENIKYFIGDEWRYLKKIPDLNSSHRIGFNYANAWIIDPVLIKGNYSPDYFQVNKDGSINIEFLLYFQPQSKFIISLIISILSIFSSSIILILFWLIEKRKIGKVNGQTK